MKTLILYATKYGSTERMAHRLAEHFNGETELVNIQTSAIPRLDSFETVVLGGPIYMGKIQKPLTNFVTAHLAALESKRLGLFICAAHPDEKERFNELEKAFPAALSQKAVVKDVLGYAIQFEKMHFFDKLIMKKIKGDSHSTQEFYDQRIRAFAETLQRQG
ncbi:flavodoxin domain-containing protein [Sporolactobacillus sp. CPB3-1]|uniref:Flavodoxin domain-containing protein n=1 Tax=Sporolactobacillus mangiferae TaxID=2940498 RepID=A0ABT0M6S6_9BACL|nr:flavodoxin domain-containing protein [Sporolactobacillus mangiferae]MCL1630358.1 flavodoxin domain-containing protein [Sporolactobacillus mangiferae]